MRLNEFKESVFLAFDTIRGHKFRSTLTVLGVIIGIMTVVAVSSLITGMDKRVNDLVSRFSADVILVSRFKVGVRFSNLTKEERQRRKLTFDDMLAIRQLPAVEFATATLFMGSFGPGQNSTVKYNGITANNPLLQATEMDHPDIFRLDVEKGRFFSQTEDDHRQAVCVVASDIATALFPIENPLEKEITIDGKAFRVVGVLAKDPNAALFGGSSRSNSYIYIPHGTFREAYPQSDDYSISIKARTGQLDKAKDQIAELLRRRRKVALDAPDGFEITGMDAILNSFSSIIATIGMVIIPISACGLLVGGVGVMNIMLVSVTERTREIGIRRAIGARRRDITTQFLVEAATLTGAGGALGIILGLLISLLLNLLLPSLPSSVPPMAVVVGFVVSVGLGLIFGMWPAIRASRLDPVEALRYE